MERTHKDTGSHHLSKTALPHYTIVRIETDSRRQAPSVVVIFMCGGDARNFEPKTRLKFEDLDKSIQKLRAIYKVHPAERNWLGSASGVPPGTGVCAKMSGSAAHTDNFKFFFSGIQIRACGARTNPLHKLIQCSLSNL